jgi:hypothetical protein
MITNADKLKCAERELSYRIRVYARLIERGKMTPHQAEHEIAAMASIVADYQKLTEQPQLMLGETG